MTWIQTIAPDRAEGRLSRLYGQVRSPAGQVDNILQAHSLRPHTMAGHMALYRNVLHHSANTLPAWLLEAIGVYVSALNRCAYCVEHHAAGLRRLLDDDGQADTLLGALRDGVPGEALDGAELAALEYAGALTRRPAAIDARSIDALRDAGLSDGEILEVNQVAAYFAYANRLVLGLGVSTEGEAELGLSPEQGGDEGGWAHR